jgi:hypothetical protein
VIPPIEDEIYYYCSRGADSTWTKGSYTKLEIVYNRSQNNPSAFSHFETVWIDGEEVSPDGYTAESGSVIIRLLPRYLETLSPGIHTLIAGFDDGGSEEIQFTVKAKKKDRGGSDDEEESVTPAAPSAPQAPWMPGTPQAKNKVVNTEDQTHLSMWAMIFAGSILVWILSAWVLKENQAA